MEDVGLRVTRLAQGAAHASSATFAFVRYRSH